MKKFVGKIFKNVLTMENNSAKVRTVIIVFLGRFFNVKMAKN